VIATAPAGVPVPSLVDLGTVRGGVPVHNVDSPGYWWDGR
jgi:hypothetical protein